MSIAACSTCCDTFNGALLCCFISFLSFLFFANLFGVGVGLLSFCRQICRPSNLNLKGVKKAKTQRNNKKQQYINFIYRIQIQQYFTSLSHQSQKNFSSLKISHFLSKRYVQNPLDSTERN